MELSVNTELRFSYMPPITIDGNDLQEIRNIHQLEGEKVEKVSLEFMGSNLQQNNISLFCKLQTRQVNYLCKKL